MLRFFFIGALLGITFSVQSVWACSVCLCGDPTLTSIGYEKIYKGRLRFALENRYRTEKVGSDLVNALELKENKVLLSASVAPTSFWMTSLSQPIEWKEISFTNGAKDSVFGLGDLSFQNKFFLWGNEETSGRHLLGNTLGVRIPTAKRYRDDTGNNLPLDVQPGTGAWYPSVGIFYGFFSYPWMFQAQTSAQFSTEGWNDFQAGEVVLNNLTLQYHTNYKIGFQMGVNSRWSKKDKERGVEESDSGGWITFLSPGLIVSPFMDFVIHASAMIPVLDRLTGFHSEGINFLLGVTYDI